MRNKFYQFLEEKIYVKLIMCAIAGIIGNQVNKINKMIDIQSHRGPDDKKTYINKNVAIGMARLSILDLKSKGLCLYKAKQDYFKL